MPDSKIRGLPRKVPDLILDMDEQGWNYTIGISFPPYPKLWDQCFRTDIRGGMMFRWNGTYWLSEQQFAYEFDGLEGHTTASGQGIQQGRFSMPELQMYLLSAAGECYVVTTNDVTHYWAWTLYGVNSANTEAAITSMGTQGGTPNTWIPWACPGLPALLSSSYRLIASKMTYANSPGACFPKAHLVYRLRAT